jgi:hypothetical protein
MRVRTYAHATEYWQTCVSMYVMHVLLDTHGYVCFVAQYASRCQLICKNNQPNKQEAQDTLLYDSQVCSAKVMKVYVNCTQVCAYALQKTNRHGSAPEVTRVGCY